MPSDIEIKKALDTIQALINAPLPGPRKREEMLGLVYKVLAQLVPDQSQDEEPEGLGDGDNLDLPFLA